MKLPTPKQRPRGFTLVEMLVATGLVLLMMLLFAQVFQTAAGLVSEQKGMAENDQSVRTLTILLRGDIKQRTFVDVVPFVPGQNTGGPADVFDDALEKGFDPGFRQGFFSISENDPNDPTDDVLHLTIRSDSPLLEEPQLPYSGRSRLLRTPGSGGAADTYLINHPDQPEFDDGQTTVNSTGSSRYAEVCWFLRNGVLYRRMLLIRDPYNRGTNTANAEEPQDANSQEFINTFYDINGDLTPDEDFWRDFDYSAYWEPGPDPPPDPPTGFGLKFHVAPASLDNTSAATGVPNLLGFPRSLGIPFLRFGSSINRAQGGVAGMNGVPPVPAIIYGPREYIVDNSSGTAVRHFIGRYTMQETADDNFGYPGNLTTATDPFNENNGPTLTMTGSGLISPYDTDPLPMPADQLKRRGQDIVMSNVHEFDIQVWDDLIRDFVDLGHQRSATFTTANGQQITVPGWFHQNRRQNSTYGSKTIGSNDGNTFDTWHPFDGIPAGTGMPPTPYAPFGSNANPPQNLTAQQDLRRDSLNGNLGLGDPEEVWLRAIRIKLRFFDEGSEQMRDLTFTFRLNRYNSRGQ